MRTVLSVVGTRPNFMKIAPVISALARSDAEIRHVLVHTGQHYDATMSSVFLEQLGVGAPDHMLAVGSGTHAVQTARAMERLEPVLLRERPDVVLVPGDVNSTLATALVAAKLGIVVGHVEAGLRSFDRTMPEEVNRVLVDQLSDVLFVHSPEAAPNLLREGVEAERIHPVGNTMIDTLMAMRPRFEALDVAGAYGLRPADYVLVTLHRPALVDGPLLLQAAEALRRLAREVPVVFPVHPRTAAALDRHGLAKLDGVRMLQPLGYLEFLSLVSRAAGVLTDSGGIQEETTFLGVPCFTLRDTTERPITVVLGTNVLLGLDPARICEVPALIDGAAASPSQRVPGWDGAAAERLVDVLLTRLPNRPIAHALRRAP